LIGPVTVFYWTIWFNGADVLPAEPGSPRYTATIACDPAPSWIPVTCAVPAFLPPTRTADPIALPSAKNCTMPVGVALFPEAFTVAVKVIACPTNDGLSDEASVVDVDAGLVPE
jgi:hypothetical protein